MENKVVSIIGNASNAKNLFPDKERIKSYTLVTQDAKGKYKTPIQIQVYMGRSSSASVVYASIWCSNHEIYISGKGSAGGYGYDKKSAAIGDAIRSAGIRLEHDIDGVGESAVKDAMVAIARFLGFTGDYIIV